MSDSETDWADWNCPYCGVEMDDPVTVKQTTCSNGHSVFLGPVFKQSGGLYWGYTRQAFKNRADKNAALKNERGERELLKVFTASMNRRKKGGE